MGATEFPFVSSLFGRTVIIGQADQNATREISKDSGLPQAYYLHNVLPTPLGFGAVGYETQSGSTSSLTGITDVHVVYGTDGARAYICRSDQGIGVYQLPGRVFTLLLPLAAPYNSSPVTTAIVNGKCYFYVSGYGCYTYEPTTNALTTVTLLGLVASEILGVCAANGYLIAYSATYVVWSSTINPEDFVPSLLTGAGGGSVQNIKGDIVTVLPTNTGLAIFSTTNAVATIYQGNQRYPYEYVEITGSGGVAGSEYVTYDTNTGNLFAYTTFGLQRITSRVAELVFPDATDFLAGQIFEDFNETALTFTQTDLTSALQKKLSLISARYLVISYGVTSLTHAIVYDLAQRRWGKLKITHSDCFEYVLLDQTISDIPKKSIAFTTSAGVVSTVNTDQKSASRNGVLLLGKFQYIRSRLMTLQNVSVENIEASWTCTCHDFYTRDGANFQTPVAFAGTQVGKSKSFAGLQVGYNHSVLLKGAFSANTLILVFSLHGKSN